MSLRIEYKTILFYCKTIYICRTETTVSFKELCEIFNTNPENLMDACDIVSELLPKEKTYKDDYTNILNKLKN